MAKNYQLRALKSQWFRNSSNGSANLFCRFAHFLDSGYIPSYTTPSFSPNCSKSLSFQNLLKSQSLAMDDKGLTCTTGLLTRFAFHHNFSSRAN